ncbi:MAG: choice-of-anchor L domain-containing protein, partial [Bacteroidota bacterium]
MKKTLVLLSINLLCFGSLFSQVVTLPYTNATDYVQNVLVGGGVTVTNVTSNCIFNAPATMGQFSGFGVTPIGLDNGVIMSSGDVQLADDPNTSGSAGTTSGTGSDPQLAALVPGYSINDAAVLEFDFVPLASPVDFRYVFASEEYPEWVNSSYNDAFGFFISGPNPGGGNYTNQNIAIIPGTSLPVTIDNVNAGSYSQYYVDNSGGTQCTYDAFTTILTATCNVTPCQTYHIKIAVGDAGDSAYDSAVFLEANSFSTDAVDVDLTYTNPGASINAVEGCNDAILSFFLASPATSPYTITYSVSGTATNGTDYNTLTGTVTIPVGSDSTGILISPVDDGVTEGNETVTIIIQTSACGSDTIVVTIEDATVVTADFTATQVLCVDDVNTITYTGIGGAGGTYLWDFNGGTVISGSGAGPYQVSWDYPGNYNVSLQLISANGCATDGHTLPITVNPIPTANFTAYSICEGDPDTITYTGNAGPGATYNWNFDGATILSGGTGQGPHIVTWTQGPYDVELTVTENGCTSDPFIVSVT